MIVLIDANVLLDASLQRQPWAVAAQSIIDFNHRGVIVGCVAATTITNLYYVIRRLVDIPKAQASIDAYLASFVILEVNSAVLERARQFSGTDFEDNVQLAAGVVHQVEAIVTRDQRGFAGSPLPVFSPDKLLLHLANRGP